MRKILQILICLPVLLIALQALSQTAPNSQSDYYEAGLAHRDAGDWMAAVRFWVSAAQISQRQQKVDPRIGIAFIELITEQKAIKYYELACEMYLWGFSQAGVQKYNKDIENEVERIAPLLNKDMRKKGHSLLKKNDPQLVIEIKSFWINKDPTPTTTTNERLLEHWQRIAHARKNFRNGKNSVYGTDDRGLIYVKYGEPERIAKGSLGTKRADFKQWTAFLIADEETISGDASRPGSPSRQRAAEQGFLIGEIDRFNNYPEYEIWFYHSFDSDAPISYMFGNREGIGRYGLRDGVEDFIPGRAFLRTSSYRTGVSPGAVLQSVYYSELMHLHPDFEDRYNELEQIWDSLGSNKSSMVANNLFRLKRQNFKTADKFNPVTAFAPSEKSNVDQKIPKVRMLVSPFRFLNKQSLPNIALVALSYPQVRMDTILSSQDKFPDYSVTHTVITYDSNHHEIRRQSEALQSGDDNVYTFILPHEDMQNDFMIITEVFHFPTTSSVDTEGRLAGSRAAFPDDPESRDRRSAERRSQRRSAHLRQQRFERQHRKRRLARRAGRSAGRRHERCAGRFARSGGFVRH